MVKTSKPKAKGKSDGVPALEEATEEALRAKDELPEGLIEVSPTPVDKGIVIASAEMSIIQEHSPHIRGMEKAKKINADKKIRIIIPLATQEKNRIKPGDYATYPRQTVTVDGHTWSIMKGVPVEIPVRIYNILLECGILGGI